MMGIYTSGWIEYLFTAPFFLNDMLILCQDLTRSAKSDEFAGGNVKFAGGLRLM